MKRMLSKCRRLIRGRTGSLIVFVLLLLYGSILRTIIQTTSILESYGLNPYDDSPTSTESFSRRRNVILLGPHDRYNFGDLLFSKVIVRLLETRAGYDRNEILFGGNIPVDMTRYGGEKIILGMKTIQKLSREDTIKGPYDIVYTGGESLGCSHECAVSMMPDDVTRALAAKEKIFDCGYLVPKNLLVPESDEAHPTNLAIANSLGAPKWTNPTKCKKAVNSADYVQFRHHDPLRPDSAVMTKELYHKEINNAAKEVFKEIFPSAEDAKMKYIAVQHHIKNINPKELAISLDTVAKHSNATIVFFAAGTIPKHDSFNKYKEVANLMEEVNIVYEVENIWKVIALISQAEAVLSTSLHVRIMAFIYSRPRVTWCTKQKLKRFIELWDADDSARCVVDRSETWSVLSDYYGPDPKFNQDKTKVVYDEMVKQYLESFDEWSGLLRPNQDEHFVY